MRSKSIIAILLISVVAVPALAQDAGPPWEVRPYLSTYTDDAARSTTESWTWNYTAIRHRFVCPYCGYSTTVEDGNADGVYECPNPFGIAPHPATQLTEATPHQRVLGELGISAENIDDLEDNPIVGRPFHPGRSEFALPGWTTAPAPWEVPTERGDVASFLTARAAGEFDQIISTDYGVRFLVVEPGAVRAAASYRLIDSLEDPTSDQFYRPAGITGAEAYGIHINPYRVSDGDVWYIRHAETNVGGGTTGLEIEVYSTLYGLNFDSEGAIDLTQYDGQTGCRVITDDGAVVIDIPKRLAAEGTGQWVIKFVIDSNTQTLPRPEEVNYDLWASEGVGNIYTDPAEQEPQFPEPGWEGTELSDSTAEKKPFVIVADTSLNPILATADEQDGEDYIVAEKSGSTGFNTQEIWPYRMPPAAAGKGRVMLQWSPRTATAAAITSTLMDGQLAYYRTGNEWHYLVDLTAPATPLVTNAATAANTPLPDAATFIDSYFMCSRLQVDHWIDIASPEDSPYYLGNDTWMNSLGTDRGDVVWDLEPATGGQPRIVLGTDHDPDPDVGAWGGEYAPGTRTPAREFTVANRTPIQVVRCPVSSGGCGTRYPASEFPPPGPHYCPACGAELGAVRAEAQVYYDAHNSLAAQVHEPAGTVSRRMTAEALRFGLSGSMVPIGAPDFVQEVFADIPAYQPPSVPASSDTEYFANDVENDFGYRGTMVAFNRPSDDGDAWDRNTTWDAYYLSPETGKKFASPEATMTDTQAQWVCSVCGLPWSRSILGDHCPYCGHSMSNPGDLPNPYVPYDTLVAEDYAPFGVQVSVLRKAALAAEQRVVDLGWIAPGVDAADAWPADVSHRSEMPVRNEGNIRLDAGMRASPLWQTGTDRAVRSYGRRGQAVPITLQTLFRYRPGPAEFGAPDWELLHQDATGAAGQTGTALLQAGVRAGAGDPYENAPPKPVPLGQPLGNYAGEVLMFVDLDGKGFLDFLSPAHGPTSTEHHAFNPDVDEPYEPVASFAARARVVESRLPHSDYYSQDLLPTMLYDPALANLQMLWAGQRLVSGANAPAGTSLSDMRPPSEPLNILYANAALNTNAAVDDPFYRGWLWENTPAAALTQSTSANQTNTSPTAYVNEGTGDRWAMWHQTLSVASGASSRLQFATSTSDAWAADPNDYIFGSADARGGLTGFLRDGTLYHWQLWQAGPQDREHLRYRPEWDPASGIVPGNERLMVTNSSTTLRSDIFSVETEVTPGVFETHTYRKPALDPFTYVRQPSAWETTNTDGDFRLDVVYTGHIRSLGNSDICWSRFNFGDPADAGFPYNTAEDNFGKAPFPRVVGSTHGGTYTADADVRGMRAARDATGAVRGYVGEQLEPSPRRQSYQARDIDWLVVRDKPDALDPDNPFNFATKPDWTGWTTDPDTPGLEEYDDPKFYVAVVTDDGSGPRQLLYAVEWSRGNYAASTGLYQVLPRLIRMTDSGMGELHDPAAPADPADPPNPPVWHPRDDSAGDAVLWSENGGVFAKALLDPNLRRQALADDLWNLGTDENLPAVTLTVNPASGMVQWSTPLFNPDDRADRGAVFNTANTANIVDVVMYADYTPFIRRVTTDSANDDSPSAFWDQGGSGRMSVFWRRSYADTDKPHFGRPSFMHRSYTRAIQVGHPKITSISLVRDLSMNEDLVLDDTYELTSDANGIITIQPDPATATDRVGHRIQVIYVGGDGEQRNEHHRVTGWSLETPVPVNTVTSEGAVRVTPEVYAVNGLDTVRYWLTWSSPRGIYDTRAAGAVGDAIGQRVHQSSDVYMAVVAPEHSSLIADVESPRLEP